MKNNSCISYYKIPFYFFKSLSQLTFVIIIRIFFYDRMIHTKIALQSVYPPAQRKHAFFFHAFMSICYSRWFLDLLLQVLIMVCEHSMYFSSLAVIRLCSCQLDSSNIYLELHKIRYFKEKLGLAMTFLDRMTCPGHKVSALTNSITICY